MRSARPLAPTARKRTQGVDAYVKELPKEQQPIVEGLRAFIFANAPHLTEKLKWGNPTYIGRSNVCWIISYRDHVDFGFFRGTELPDPKGILEGTGKGLRHVKIYRRDDIPEKLLRSLLVAALKLDGA